MDGLPTSRQLSREAETPVAETILLASQRSVGNSTYVRRGRLVRPGGNSDDALRFRCFRVKLPPRHLELSLGKVLVLRRRRLNDSRLSRPLNLLVLIRLLVSQFVGGALACGNRI